MDLKEILQNKVSILDKVGNIEYLFDNFATVEQVAKYYDVGIEAIKAIREKKERELEKNGYLLIKGKELINILKNKKIDITYMPGYFMVNNNTLSYRGNGLFTKESILYIGLMLQESNIANKIKNELDVLIYIPRKELCFINSLINCLKPFKLKGEKQYQISSYRIDFYIPKLNIAIEYDENNHKGYTYEQQELRQALIEKELGCRFIRVSDKYSDEYNIGLVFKELFQIAC